MRLGGTKAAGLGLLNTSEARRAARFIGLGEKTIIKKKRKKNKGGTGEAEGGEDSQRVFIVGWGPQRCGAGWRMLRERLQLLPGAGAAGSELLPKPRGQRELPALFPLLPSRPISAAELRKFGFHGSPRAFLWLRG